MLAVACLQAAAERDKILIHVDHGAFGRLRGSGVVSAFVEGDPTPLILITAADLWPGQSTTHRWFLGPPCRRPAIALPGGASRCGDSPLRDDRITGPHDGVKKGVLHVDNSGSSVQMMESRQSPAKNRPSAREYG